MGYRVIDRENYYRKDVFRHFSEDCKCSVSMTARVDVSWGRYREENGRLVMPVSVRLNHAAADGYLIANVFRLLQREIGAFAGSR